MDEEYERRLRHRLGLLKEHLAAGQLYLPHDDELEASLLAIRAGADGKVDLSTVDGRVRALALAIEASEHVNALKSSISLREIQDVYFQFVERNFGPLYRGMLKEKATPAEMAAAISRDPEAVVRFVKGIPGFMSDIVELWSSTYEIAHFHATDLQGLKTVFGGEIFPEGTKNVASSCGVYVDTIVLPEPFIRSRMFIESGPDDQRVYWLIKHALSVLQYKDLALTDLETPIAVIIPDTIWFDERDLDYVQVQAERDLNSHLQLLFGRSFHDADEVTSFLKRFHAPDDVIAALKDKSRLLFEVGAPEPLAIQLRDYINEWTRDRGIKHAGQAVLTAIHGRMMQANDLLVRSQRIGGPPLIEAPTSWRYLNWKLEYTAREFSPDESLNLHLIRGLQSAAAAEMAWLGNVPVKTLIEMRQTGALAELRGVLSKGVAEMVEARPDNFFRTGDKIVDNIQSAFDEHKNKLTQLTGKKWRFAGVELASCVVHGAIEIASACGVPLVSLVNSAMDQVIDVPKFRDIPGKFKSLKDEGRALARSPVGLLFQESNRKK
ncbi:hypothetical protein [Microvirga solisilvae]|uniref:hypothetical protein n=1 Tax=Microvirga solisilvae TaxID=2919498 RepID=UPI001FAF4B9C|nr:hypothetical protein [Microvirga solisilvae]